MTKDDFFRDLDGRKLFDGKADQIKAWSEVFVIRKDAMGFYIAWRYEVGPVTGTGNFDQWGVAKSYLSDNWQRLIDEEFERQVLIGSEGNTVNDDAKDSSST